MKIILLVSVAVMLLLEVFNRKLGASSFQIYLLVLCLIVLAVGAYEAWSKKRGVLGWIVNILASAFGAFLAIGLLGFCMKMIMPRLEPVIAPRILDYVTAVIGTSVLVILSWLSVKVVDLFRGRLALTKSGTTKWWWLRYFGVQKWTAEERKARMALGITMLVNAVIGLICVDVFLAWLGVDPHVSAPLAALASLVPALLSTRPIASILYPDLLRAADHNAGKRLSGI